VMVLDARGITAEDVKFAEAAIMDSEFFPRPYDVAESCTNMKGRKIKTPTPEEIANVRR